jgi:hypothetical protein
VSREKNLRKMKRSTLDVQSSSNLKRKNSEDKILLVHGFKELNEFITELKSNIHHNSIIITQLDYPCLIYSTLGEKNHKKLIKTSCGATVIKPTS